MLFQFLLGLGMFVIGLRMFRYFCPKLELKSLPPALSQNMPLVELELRRALIQAETAIIREKMGRLVGNELDSLVLQDALNREQRAKAIVTTLLKLNNCSEEQIQEVLDQVEGSGKDGR